MSIPVPAKKATRVLIVDDDAATRDGLARLLASDGFAVQTSGGGQAALELAAAHAPDIVVTDLKMPGMDGLELLARLHEQDRDLPVIPCTSTGAHAPRPPTAGRMRELDPARRASGRYA